MTARTAAHDTPPPRWLGSGHIPGLDGIRCLAVLMVIYAHGHFPLDGIGPLHVLKGRCGFLGVQIFFVLSGFLITTLMLREIDRTGRVSLRQFYLRRVLRIVPAYLAYLAVLAVLQVSGQARLGGRHWLALATYTVNFLPSSLPETIAHVWSLSVEEHFYLLWPLVMAVLTPAGCRKAVLACAAGALGLRWWMLLTLPERNCPVDLWTFTRIDDIAAGCLLALLARDGAWRARLDRLTASNHRLALIAVVFAASQLCLSRLVGGRLFAPLALKLLIGLANDVNTAAIAVLMWAVLARPASVVTRGLNLPAVRYVGVISYSLYLWHPLFCDGGPPLLCAFPQNLVCIFLTAVLSHTLVERPFLALKERLSSARQAPVAVAVPREFPTNPPLVAVPRHSLQAG
jgi:peptidoglycan/LPS O-acetylase OafA/YrhL